MKKLFFMLLSAVVLLSCENEKEDGGKGLVLTGDTQASQIVYADQTSGASESIKFKADKAWYASVSEMPVRSGGSEIDWLTLDAYSGGAGEYALTMTLKENHTGSDRKAEIKIVCGETIVTISVEQKATTSSGVEPLSKRLVKRIVRGSGSVSFEYDNNRTITKIITKRDGITNTSTFKVSNLAITEGKDNSSISYVIGESLCIEEGSETQGEESKYTYSDGRMTVEAISYMVDDTRVSDSTFYVWENGNLKTSLDKYSNNSIRYEYECQEPYICIANVCLYRILTAGYEDFQALDYFGKDSRNLISKITSSGDKWDKENGVRKFRYVKDDKGYVTKIYEQWTPAERNEEAEVLLYEIEYY